ncbi:DUF4030 domain-containing protein [Bacillus sp. FJAT-29814]|uniref:DUF4030 domain-containing protein n=1 Tax=Bacillus sp. FJAT-29814 TaxID=1729688 RepID=UPI000830AD3C|nr:DUF4030 domain-containing protein [Bacillus sp. FJAT-29814]
MGSKKEVNLSSLEHLQVPDTLEKFIADLPDRYANGEIDKEIKEQTEKDWNTFRHGLKGRKAVWKLVAAVTVSVAAAFGLFVGSAFVSPAMAQIVSTIPYLGGLFESKPLFEEVKEALDQKQYQYGQLGVSIPEKEVTVGFEGTAEYYNEVKTPAEELIKDILKKRNNDAYKVRVFHDPDAAKRAAEIYEKADKEFDAEANKVTAIVGEVLQKYGYEPNGIGVSSDRRINIEYIPKTETRLDQIKSDILTRLQQEQIKEYKIKFYLIDPNLQEREGRLVPLYLTMTEGLTARTEFKVSGTGYSNNKERFYIEVRTTVSSTDAEQEEVAAKAEQTIKEFLQTEEAKTAVQTDIYEIVILSRDKKTLRTIKN